MFSHCIIGCPGHIMAVDIMKFPVCGLPVFIVTDHVLRKRSLKACGLIHVIPYSHDTHVGKRIYMLSPPVSDSFSTKIGIIGIPRPDRIHIVFRIVRISEKVTVFGSFLIHKISLFAFCSGIYYHYGFEPF